jgi:hypothetical protein
VTAYGFDLDETLDRPALAQLANDLHDAGHEVYVVTGGLSDEGEWTMAARQEKLAALGVRCTAVIRCIDPDIARVGVLKGQECRRLGIAVMIDDSRLYLDGVAAASDAVRLLVL